MPEITLVFTKHKECGNCNAEALGNIIANINPEIIFEELSDKAFHKIYEEKSLTTLETDTIKEYTRNHSITHLFVDNYPRPKLYDEDVDTLYEIIFNRPVMEECRELRYLLGQHIIATQQYGFKYLDSNANDVYFEQLDTLKYMVVNKLNDEKLLRICRLEKETIAKREDQVLENIYNFSLSTSYKKAMLMMGSGHRKSFLQLIKKTKMPEGIQVHWKTYFQ